MKFRALALVLLLLAAGCRRDHGDVGRQLSGAEIRQLFSDKTVEGHHELHGYDFKSYYDASGRYRSHQSDKQAPRPAKWWVTGDDICIRWDDTPQDLCRRMFLDAGGVYRKVDVRGDNRSVVVTFKRFTPGNPHRL